MQEKRQTLNRIIRKTFDLVFGGHLRAHKIPFGPIAGSYLYTRPSISPRMFAGIDEKKLMQVVSSILREGDTVYDIGAHIGYLAVLFARLTGSTGTIHCFELMPETAEILKKSIELNKFTNCRIHTVGLGNSSTQIDVPMGDTFMGALDRGFISGAGNKVESCRVVRLDDYREENAIDLPALIKIDIEGGEVEALKGAAQTIQKSSPLIIVEFHNLSLIKNGVELLNSFGYTVQLLSGKKITPQFSKERHDFHENVICFKEDCEWHRERMGV